MKSIQQTLNTVRAPHPLAEHEAGTTNQSSMPHIQGPGVKEPREMVQQLPEKLQMPHHLSR
ncbi:hypothetical protein DPMN_082395 [Dreissena polymorpha]|uniref:Uncharacterized protein n=1 Tax=Dreissena polymorpha TaxID=45954 RepID=A0A9D3YAI6_DREPO|nr:hypothetical protein DPMN_082395 [Dreissena polymorpha]